MSLISQYKQVDSKKSVEALINEFKGNIFEYLVGICLARHFRLEERFLEAIRPDFRKRMLDYERALRELDIGLFHMLPGLAEEAVNEILNCLEFNKVENVTVVGKLEGDKKEADIIIFGKSKITPISLKLAKSGSFVNTKSGGIKSFITTYFASYERSQIWQDRLNREVAVLHKELAETLYGEVNLPFSGGFDQSWVEEGYSELPGELPDKLRCHVLSYYCQLVKIIHTILKDCFELDQRNFAKSLLPILGFGHKDIVQVILFHAGVKGDERYNVRKVNISKASDIEILLNQEVKMVELKEEISSFEIYVGNLLLQIRVKPMNKFTAQAVKINCSVKY